MATASTRSSSPATALSKYVDRKVVEGRIDELSRLGDHPIERIIELKALTDGEGT